MAKRRKNRTHLKGAAPADATKEGDPKSFVVKHGQVGRSIAQLTRDMRKVMEPNTASRLKERSRNKLKDYLTLAPSLHVSHLLAFTLTPVSPSLRMVRLPGGPTLSFRVERYSLIKDLLNSSRRARSVGMEYLSSPLLVLSSFPPPNSPNSSPHLTLLTKTFQSLFPTLSPHTLSLSSARRVVLISYIPENGTIEFRHYLITVKPYGVSRRVRKVLESATKGASALGKKGVDLGKVKDVADYVLRTQEDGYETASTSAASDIDPSDAEQTVKLSQDYVGRNNAKGSKRAIKLDEIGPRMEMRLIKIVEGVPGKEGGVIYHEFVKKSKKEAEQLKASAAEREKLRKQRREEQERNVERKKNEKGKGVSFDDDEEPDGREEPDEADEDEDAWASDDHVSDGEDGSGSGSASESEEEPPQRPAKKFKPRR